MSRVIKSVAIGAHSNASGRGVRGKSEYPFTPFSEEQLRQTDNGPEGILGELQDDGSFDGSGTVDLEQRLREEFQAGFNEGRRFTEKKLRDELADRLAENRNVIETLTTSIAQEYRLLHEDAERDIVGLAIAIAERIVKRELTMDGEVVIRQIHEATKRIIGVERIKIRINPEDEECVRDHRLQILTSTDVVRDLVIEPDETIERGGCILESEAGNVDALIATQMERIEAALLGGSNERK